MKGTVFIPTNINKGIILMDAEDWFGSGLKIRIDVRADQQLYCRLKGTCPKSGQKGRFLHRYLLDARDPEVFVDHINGNPLDNRKKNLRLATPMQSAANRGPQKNSLSRHRGVTFTKSGKRIKRWRAEVRHKGKVYYVGRYKTEDEAALAWNDAAKKIYKSEYVRYNKL